MVRAWKRLDLAFAILPGAETTTEFYRRPNLTWVWLYPTAIQWLCVNRVCRERYEKVMKALETEL
jgi:hypothetical protein